VKDPAVALNVALAEFAATDTLAGTVTLLVEANVTVVADATALLSVTVQAATAAGPSDDGLHETPPGTGVTVVVTVPPVPLIVSAPPSSVAPKALETPIAAELAVAAKVIETVATVPLAMTLVLIPVARQMYPAEELAQFSVFEAEVSAGPAVTTKPLTEAAG
jgi:hypothetical protein